MFRLLLAILHKIFQLYNSAAKTPKLHKPLNLFYSLAMIQARQFANPKELFVNLTAIFLACYMAIFAALNPPRFSTYHTDNIEINGAISATFSDITTGYMGANGASDDEIREASQIFNPIFAAITSGGDQSQFGINSGLNTSLTENNYLNHGDVANLKLDITSCVGDEDCIQGVLLEYNKLSEDRNNAISDCPDYDCVLDLMEDAATFTDDDRAYLRSLNRGANATYAAFLEIQQIDANAIAGHQMLALGIEDFTGMSSEDAALAAVVLGSLGGDKGRLSKTDFPEIQAQVSQKQNRHIEGRPEYRGGGTMASKADAQEVLDAYHSNNVQILGKNDQGFPVVQYTGVTGNNSPGAGYVDQATNVFIIKGTASPSIVPTNPNWTPK